MAKKIVTTTQKVCFVQFTHPGEEHVIPKKYNVKKDFLYPWNYLNHKRKFIETTAHYINQYDEILNDKILFWGEWEPSLYGYKHASPSYVCTTPCAIRFLRSFR